MISRAYPFARSLVTRLSPQRLHYSTINTAKSPLHPIEDPVHAGPHLVRIPNRAFLQLEGADSVKFLQGLVTNHMPKIENGGAGFFAAFLAPNGRVLNDVFIYPKNKGLTFPHPVFLLECDSRSLPQLQAHLRKYILRSKLKLQPLGSASVWSVWGPGVPDMKIPKAMGGVPGGGLVVRERGFEFEVGLYDTRVEGMGHRVVVLEEQARPELPSEFTELESEEYTLRRLLFGVPEGIDDLVPGQSLPLESNFDYMGGIDFRKGCYVGQELTIRTYHTGVIRKRIVPVALYRENEPFPTALAVDRKANFSLPVPGADILSTHSRRPIGKFCSSARNLGLALMRLEAIEQQRQEKDVVFTVQAGDGSTLRVAPFPPGWWPRTDGQPPSKE
ncbi:uncharacterized protein VTP21DRAFT_5032 [Calcarisporiella thermophila]|uniref:uncharacterized protein n=1 Tax=Calcarisporiella thermophila TaxID=911321 RepID=UPI0037429C97